MIGIGGETFRSALPTKGGASTDKKTTTPGCAADSVCLGFQEAWLSLVASCSIMAIIPKTAVVREPIPQTRLFPWFAEGPHQPAVGDPRFDGRGRSSSVSVSFAKRVRRSFAWDRCEHFCLLFVPFLSAPTFVLILYSLRSNSAR